MQVTPFLVIPLVTWAIAQTIKFVLALFRGDIDLRYLIASGGMPSVHSAVVCSLMTIALAEGGLSSPLFGITGVLAAIVMYDSFGVRRSAGEQAKALNKLIADLSDDGDIKHPEEYGRLREIVGHRPIEVSIGAVLGVAIALLFEADKLGSHLAFLIQPASKIELIVFIILATIMIISGLVAFFVLPKRFKGQKSVASFRWHLLTCLVSGGVTLLILVLSGYESALYLTARLLPYFVIIIWGIWFGAITARFGSGIATAQQEQLAYARRERWLAKTKKNRHRKSK